MKKKLEADLMSIAHRVLQMKNKSDINQLYFETQKLYEKLSVLRFVDQYFEDAKPTIGLPEVKVKLEQAFEEIQSPEVQKQVFENEIVSDEIVVEEINIENSIVEEIAPQEVVVAEIIPEEIVLEEVAPVEVAPLEVIAEDSSSEKTIVGEIIVDEDDIDQENFEYKEEIVVESLENKVSEVDFLPAFELDTVEEEKVAEPQIVLVKPEEVQISFMDLLGGDYTETMFVKVDHNEVKSNALDFNLPKETAISQETTTQEEREAILAKIQITPNDTKPKAVSLNDKLANGISIDLNDRIGFVKNLFGNSEEDYTRVLNQLITYDNFEEARSFIEDMVKPDYNDWEGKQEYEKRFIEIVEKKFA